MSERETKITPERPKRETKYISGREIDKLFGDDIDQLDPETPLAEIDKQVKERIVTQRLMNEVDPYKPGAKRGAKVYKENQHYHGSGLTD